MTLQTETVRRIADVQEQLDNLVSPAQSDDLASPFLVLPGLRGFWSMSAFQSNGDCFDQSGNGRLLTYNGNPTYNYDGLAPYIDLDGVGDYLSRVDEAATSITGTETYVAGAVRGLTYGGWFYPDLNTGTEMTLMSKFNTVGNQRSYSLHINNVNSNIRSYLSTNGVALETFSNVNFGALTYANWYFVVLRWIANSQHDIFTNGVWDRNASGIASIFDSTADLIVGAIHGGTRLLNGRANSCFLCATAHSDGIIESAFQQTRAAFGV